MYEGIGDRLKFNWTGFEAWVISSNEEALKRVGLRPHKRIPCSTAHCLQMGGLPDVQRQEVGPTQTAFT